MAEMILKDLIDYVHSLDIKEYDYSQILKIHNKFGIYTNYSIFSSHKSIPSSKENIVLRFTMRAGSTRYGYFSKRVRFSIKDDSIEVLIDKDRFSFDNGYDSTLIVLEHGRDILKLFETEVEIYFS